MQKALVFGAFDLRYVDLPKRTPGPGEVRAKMIVALLGDHSVRIYEGHIMPDIPPRKHPVTLCYAGVGEVVEIGEGVTGLKPGDLVYPNYYRSCGECDMCRADKMVACRKLPAGGLNMMVGEEYESALQTEIIFPEARMRPIPAGADLEAVAMTGSASVSMQAVVALDPQPWNTVAILGAGLLGSVAIQLCRLKGAAVVASDLDATRRERALQQGAQAAIDANSADADDQIIQACGSMPDYVIDAAGTPESSKTAMNIIARGGHFAAIGVSQEPLSQLTMVIKGLTLYGIGGGVKVQETIDLIASGRLDMSDAVGHRFPFSQLKEALEFKLGTPGAKAVAVYVDESRMP